MPSPRRGWPSAEEDQGRSDDDDDQPSPRRRVMTMRTLVLWPIAAGLLVAGCSAGGTVAEGSATVASASASGGAVASADSCPQGPPARSPLVNDSYENDGVVGTIANNTGADIWISNDAGPNSYRGVTAEKHRAPCLLAPGKRAAFAGSMDAVLYVSSTPTNRSGSRVYLFDPDIGYPAAYVTGFTEPFSVDNYSCGADPLDNIDFSEDESRDFEARNGEGYTGKVTVVRLPDDEAAANEYTGRSSATDDWARMDVTVNGLGSCS